MNRHTQEYMSAPQAENRRYRIALTFIGTAVSAGPEPTPEAIYDKTIALAEENSAMLDLLTRLHARITNADWCDEYAVEMAEIEAVLKLEAKP